MTTTKKAVQVSRPNTAGVRVDNFSAPILRHTHRRVNIRLTERFWNIVFLVILFIGLPVIYMLLQMMMGVA